jgi:hypothetical protein
MKVVKKKKNPWDKLSKEDKKKLMSLADSLYISPMFVEAMYNSGQITLP